VAEHVAAFRSLAKALRVVGMALVAVGAVLAVLGVGAAVMAAGAVVWGAGDALNATVEWAEGRTSGRQLLVAAGLALGLSVVGGGEEELVKTLGHERTHVWQVKTYGYLQDDKLARQMEKAAKATEAQWWDHYQDQMNRQP
jgi:hypothetical protein